MTIEELINSYYENNVRTEDNNLLEYEIPQIIINKHINNEIDLLSLFLELKEGDQYLFSSFPVLENLTKKVDLDIFLLFKCCLQLSTEAGNDLSSSEPKKIFINYLVLKSDDFTDIFESALKNRQYHEYLDWFLLAGYQIDKNRYIQQSIKLLDRDEIELLNSVIFSLSLAEITDQKQIESILDKFQIIIEKEFIETYSRILRVISSFKYLDAQIEEKALSLINKLLEKLDDRLIHQSILSLQINEHLSKAMESKLISAVLHVKLESQGTFREIDRWLRKLVHNNKIDQALSFIAQFNKKHNIILDLRLFQSFKEAFYHQPEKRDHLVTVLFLSQNYDLMSSFYHIWGDILHREAISVDENSLKKSTINQPALYLAKKTYGWLFIHSNSMISYIFSLLPHVLDEEKTEIKEILRLIALNYPTLFNDYFEKIIENNSKNRWIFDVKKDIDQYFEDLKALSPIPEIYPPSKNRIYRNMIIQEHVTKGYKEANKNSLLSHIATKQRILYGRGTISGKINTRQEIVLQKMESSTYLPLIYSLDPYNHVITLRNYKEDNCKESQ